MEIEEAEELIERLNNADVSRAIFETLAHDMRRPDRNSLTPESKAALVGTTDTKAVFEWDENPDVSTGRKPYLVRVTVEVIQK